MNGRAYLPLGWKKDSKRQAACTAGRLTRPGRATYMTPAEFRAATAALAEMRGAHDKPDYSPVGRKAI